MPSLFSVSSDLRTRLISWCAGLNHGTWLPDRLMRDEDTARRPVAGLAMSVIFVRRDFWTLGAPASLEEAARRTWRQEWVCCLRLDPDHGWQPWSIDGELYS